MLRAASISSNQIKHRGYSRVVPTIGSLETKFSQSPPTQQKAKRWY